MLKKIVVSSNTEILLLAEIINRPHEQIDLFNSAITYLSNFLFSEGINFMEPTEH